MAIIIVCS